jgi:hypothetical protein
MPKGIGYRSDRQHKNPKMRKMRIMSHGEQVETLIKHADTGKFPESIRMPSMKMKKRK